MDSDAVEVAKFLGGAAIIGLLVLRGCPEQRPQTYYYRQQQPSYHYDFDRETDRAIDQEFIHHDPNSNGN